jgi:hypothetical protein
MGDKNTFIILLGKPTRNLLDYLSAVVKMFEN